MDVEMLISNLFSIKFICFDLLLQAMTQFAIEIKWKVPAKWMELIWYNKYDTDNRHHEYTQSIDPFE